MSEKDPCPSCGALPCDWVDDPHHRTNSAEDERRAIMEWLREAAPQLGHEALADAISRGDHRRPECSS